MMMMMKRSFLALLVLAGYMLKGVPGQQCGWSGFGGCECNILGVCDTSGKPQSSFDKKLTGYAPSGVEQFGFTKGFNTNLAYLCEGNTVAILYDCNARIPLYAATMMTGAQLNGPSTGRPSGGFRSSGDKQLDQHYQQNNFDYKDSSKREICYESPPSNYFVDPDWYSAAQPGKTVGPSQPCNSPYGITKSIHKGHLIAARYGRGDIARSTATFTYTNAVPQFGVFNSGQWNRDEGKEVVTWGQNNCAVKGTRNVRMFIVVGAIPSTFGTFPHRFFGESGFSDYQGRSTRANTYGVKTGKKEYRVNVPRLMWTAVCCTFQFQDAQGNWKDGVQSTAFYRENEPGKQPNDMGSFAAKLPPNIQPVRVFPQNLGCNY